MTKDNIYAEQDIPGDFQFNDLVAEVFPDMIQRSVPIYNAILENIPLLGHRYIQDQTNVYDLGCSLGAMTFAVRQSLPLKQGEVPQGVNFYAVDNSEAMIQRAKLKLAGYQSNYPTHFLLDNIENVTITNASLVIMNFVLQFFKPAERYAQLERIYAGLNPGGVLMLSEKFINPDPLAEEQICQLHWDFKAKNGYSQLEIERKRNAIENIMILDTLPEHLARLEQIGFKAVIWQLGFNFCSILAFKPQA
ncbi:carboxy-S-adenosyl-L-methionine synthase CmoA [Psittacicella melopsittaci]|uniref:Carboxy-S-adenosyl-L-methionine synthase n=1 Tax=Psittacicella melopsittaci TaxID=2028576 RepID=A0A3A1Y5U3_9GAMM|nr:carboxy-S-adenosyl-L-methionine synthase CmoA [Psittacicella melopsittaci]RIY32646.1 carboxy-S-adenosyl-L-methionine synthase CmoA [Psittacicella melopsittaci]